MKLNLFRFSKAASALLLSCLSLTSTLAAESEEEAGFKQLFDGTTLTGWTGDPQFWRVEEGAIVGESTAEKVVQENTFLYWTDGELDDFDLRIDFKIESGNSGVQIRSFHVPESEGSKHAWRLGGYQADIEAGMKYPGLIYGEKFRGILAQRGEKAIFKDGAKKAEVIGATGDPAELLKVYDLQGWNTCRVVAKGHVIEHYLNGTLMAVLDDQDTANRRRTGLLGLQMHAGDPMKVHFKNIRVKRFPIEDKKKVVFIAGTPSHGLGAHEHNAGCKLLASSLTAAAGDSLLATVYTNGWPNDPTAFQNAHAVVMYCDGGGRHFAKFHLRQLDELHKAGVGIGAIHYGVEIPKGEGLEEFVSWMGGGFETDYSVNPHWTPHFSDFPDHPVANGVKPFSMLDEWYFHMRFRENMEGVTPILSAVAPAETMTRSDGPHSGNPHVRASVEAGEPQHVCWVAETPGAGRGFGFTGGHFHKNWQNDDFRKTALNAIAWIAGLEVPEDGIVSPPLTDAEIAANQDPEAPKKTKPAPKDKGKPVSKEEIDKAAQKRSN